MFRRAVGHVYTKIAVVFLCLLIVLVLLLTLDRPMEAQDFENFWIILAVFFNVGGIFCGLSVYLTLRHPSLRQFPLILWSFIIWTDAFDTFWMIPKVNMAAAGDLSFYLTSWSCTLSGAVDNFTQLSRSVAELVLAMCLFGIFFSKFRQILPSKMWWFAGLIVGPAALTAFLPAVFNVIDYNGGWCSSLDVAWEVATSLVPCNAVYLLMIFFSIGALVKRAGTGKLEANKKSKEKNVDESFLLRSLMMIFTGGILVVPYTLTKVLAASGYNIANSSSLLYFTAVAYPLAAIVECAQFLSCPSVRKLLPFYSTWSKFFSLRDTEEDSEKGATTTAYLSTPITEENPTKPESSSSSQTEEDEIELPTTLDSASEEES